MTNILRFAHIKLGAVTLLAAIFLQGCGAERTTPYNPDISSSSSSAIAVTTQSITQGTTTSSVLDHNDKRLQVMRNSDDYYDITDGYVNFNLQSQNFTDGQVVLIDLGEQDSCKQHLEFNSIRAEEAGAEGVKVVISYRAIAAVSTTCTPVITRPYYLYYVQSRDALIFSETIQ
jgi:hypothetical protein